MEEDLEYSEIRVAQIGGPQIRSHVVFNRVESSHQDQPKAHPARIICFGLFGFRESSKIY